LKGSTSILNTPFSTIYEAVARPQGNFFAFVPDGYAIILIEMKELTSEEIARALAAARAAAGRELTPEEIAMILAATKATARKEPAPERQRLTALATARKEPAPEWSSTKVWNEGNFEQKTGDGKDIERKRKQNQRSSILAATGAILFILLMVMDGSGGPQWLATLFIIVLLVFLCFLLYHLNESRNALPPAEQARRNERDKKIMKWGCLGAAAVLVYLFSSIISAARKVK
jgi:hypothetical protein